MKTNSTFCPTGDDLFSPASEEFKAEMKERRELFRKAKQGDRTALAVLRIRYGVIRINEFVTR